MRPTVTSSPSSAICVGLEHKYNHYHVLASWEQSVLSGPQVGVRGCARRRHTVRGEGDVGGVCVADGDRGAAGAGGVRGVGERERGGGPRPPRPPPSTPRPPTPPPPSRPLLALSSPTSSSSTSIPAPPRSLLD
eukprot:1547320-Rhodomonas_salina.1